MNPFQMTSPQAESKQGAHRCPRCDYRLVPVVAVERGQRRVIALSCPEPYCDHMQMVSREDGRRYERAVRKAK